MSLRGKFARLRARLALAAGGRLLQAHYAGASTAALFWDWAVSVIAPDSKLRGNATLMRARARERADSDPLVAGFLLALVDNIVGPQGIRLQPKVTTGKGRRAKLNKPTNWAIEDAWREWGHAENASADQRTSWVDMQAQIVRNLAVDGEVFIRDLPGADNEFAYAVQLINPDLVDESYYVPAKDGQNEIRAGIELDKNLRAVAYYVLTAHPSEISPTPKRRERIDAGEIKHLFVQLEPTQTRGVTWFAPVLTKLKHLDGYEEAELVAARMQASQAGAIINKNPDLAAAYSPPKNADGSAREQPPMEMAPGVLPVLPPGYEIQNYAPTHPNMAFGEFYKTLCLPISRALGVSYLTLTGDVSAANYSSMRAGLIPERDYFRRIQFFLADHVCRWVYRRWLPMALATGMLQVDGRLRADVRSLYAVAWKPRGWQWVDPLKDLQAAEKEIALGLASRTRKAADRGDDFEQVVDEIADEQGYAEGEGVDVSVDRKAAAQAPAESDSSTDDAPPTRALVAVG